MKRHLRVVHLFALPVLGFAFHMLLGCSLGGPLREDPPAAGYQLAKLPSHWTPLADRAETDAAFSNTKTDALIAMHSLCKHYADATLASLAHQLLSSFENPAVISQENKMLVGREALWTHVRAKLDGVPVESQLVVMRKDECIFDFMLHGKNKLEAGDMEDFRQFVQGFKYHGND